MIYSGKTLRGAVVDWTILGDDNNFKIANSGRRPVKASDRISGDVPYYGANNIQDYVEGYTHDGTYVLIAEDGSASLKNYSIQWASGKFWANNHVHVLRGINSMNSRFLFHYLRIVNFIPFLSGGERAKLTKGKLVQIPIPVPSLEVQIEIVRILDTHTNLIAELEAELTARRKQYNYYREQLFSFDENEVQYLQMGDDSIGKFQRGKRFVKDDLVPEGIPCIHYGEMYTYYGIWANKSKSFLTRQLVENKNLRVAEKGDVVIVAAGETIEDLGKGTAWLGDESVVIHDACFLYKTSLNPKFVAYFTRTKQFHDQIKKHISSGKISAIHANGLGKVFIPVPSPEEQERIINILDKFDVLTTSISEGLPKEIALRKKQYEYYRDMLLIFPKHN